MAVYRHILDLYSPLSISNSHSRREPSCLLSSVTTIVLLKLPKKSSPIVRGNAINQCSAMDLVALSRYRDTTCQQSDWILFPDPYQKPTIILHQVLHAIGADRGAETLNAQKNSSSEQFIIPVDTRNSSCKKAKIAIDGRSYAFGTDSDLSSPNPDLTWKATEQSRPSPQRLPTPDIPDIEEGDFWPSLENSHDNEVVITSVLQTAQAQILCTNDEIAKLDVECNRNGRNIDVTTKEIASEGYRKM